MTFAELMQAASNAAKLAGQAAEAAVTFKRNYDAAKATLSATEQSELDAQLASIHAENMRLSADIDAAAAEAETKE